MTRVCHIICAGPCNHLQFDPQDDDLIIAVDGGLIHCIEYGIGPNLFIGDLDSLPQNLRDSINCESIVLPVEKDDTDTLYACKEGLKRGYKKFKLYAALGGDVGHELANIQTLAFLSEHEAHGELIGDSQSIYLVTPQASPVTFTYPPKTRVSVFSFGGNAEGVLERGMRWGLEDAILTPALPMGVSNYNTSETFEIGVENGCLIVVIGS